MKTSLMVLALLVNLTLTEVSHAKVVTVSYSATITSLGSFSSTPLVEGDQITGSFTFNDTAPFFAFPGFVDSVGYQAQSAVVEIPALTR